MQENKRFYKKIIIFLGVIACVLSKNETIFAQQRGRQQKQTVRPVARPVPRPVLQRSRAVASRPQAQSSGGQLMQPFYPIGLSLEQYEQLTFEQVGHLEDLYKNDRNEYNKVIQDIIRLDKKTQKTVFPKAQALLTSKKSSVLDQPKLEPLSAKASMRRLPALEPIVSFKESIVEEPKSALLTPVIELQREKIESQRETEKEIIGKLADTDPFKNILGKYSSGWFSSDPSVFVYLEKNIKKDLEKIKKGALSLSFGSSADFVKAVAFLQNKTKEFKTMRWDKEIAMTDSLSLFVQQYKQILELCQEYGQIYVKSFLQKPRSEAVQQKAKKELELFFAQCNELIARYNEIVQSCCNAKGVSLFKHFVPGLKTYFEQELLKIRMQPRTLLFLDNADAAILAEKYSHLFYVCDQFQELFVKQNVDLDQMRDFIQKSFQELPASLHAYESQKEIVNKLRGVIQSLYKELKKGETRFEGSDFEEPYFVFSLFKQYLSIELKMSDLSKDVLNPELKGFFMRFMRSFADHLANRVRKLDDDDYLIPFKTILNDLDQIAKGDSSLKESFLRKHQPSVLALSSFSMMCYCVKTVFESRSFFPDKEKAQVFYKEMNLFAQMISDRAWKKGVEKVFDSVDLYLKSESPTSEDRKITSIANLYIAASFFAQSKKVLSLSQSFDLFFRKGGAYFDDLCEQLTSSQVPKIMFALASIDQSRVQKIEYSVWQNDRAKTAWEYFFVNMVKLHTAIKNKKCYQAESMSHLNDDYSFLKKIDAIQACSERKFLNKAKPGYNVDDQKRLLLTCIKELYSFAQKRKIPQSEVEIALEAMQLMAQIYVEFCMAVEK